MKKEKQEDIVIENDNNDLLREAVLDAKKVKEVAVKIAKESLEEEFKPRLQSIISARLKNESELKDSEGEEDPEQKEDDNVEEQMGEFMKEASEVDEKDESPEMSEKDEDDNNEDVDTKSEENKEDVDSEAKVKDGEIEVPSKVGEQDVNINVDSEDDEINIQIEPDEEDVDELAIDENEINIESVIRELEQECSNDDTEDDLTEKPIDESEDDILDEDSEIDLELEDDPSKEDDDGLDFSIEDDEDEFKTDDDSEKEEELENLKKENIKLTESYNKAIKVVKYLKDKLNEINLCNSKLLFANKIFKEFILTSDSKKKIIESLDRAKTTREAKLIYVALAESISSNSVKRQNPKFIRTITENMASTKIASTKPSKKIINEETDKIKIRFQKLAGILNE